MLELNVTNREVKILGEEEFVRGTVGANCKITLDEFWSGYANTVVFKRDGRKPINIIIDSLDNTIEIPHEILAESGEFKIGVFGLKPDEVLPTLWSENIKIRYGTDTHGTIASPPTPSEYQQLIELSKETKEIAQSVRDDADNGKFKGEKGDKGDKGDAGEVTFQTVKPLIVSNIDGYASHSLKEIKEWIEKGGNVLYEGVRTLSYVDESTAFFDYIGNDGLYGTIKINKDKEIFYTHYSAPVFVPIYGETSIFTTQEINNAAIYGSPVYAIISDSIYNLSYSTPDSAIFSKLGNDGTLDYVEIYNSNDVMVKSYEAVNKGYVDNLVGDIETLLGGI